MSADRVLVVDDEEDLRSLVAFNLREAGFEVETAPSGEEGLEMAAKIKPHVVVLDLMLPGISGTDVCKELRSKPELSDPAILMLTARGDEADRVLGFEVGADDYVVKPFSVKELVLRVRTLAKRANERRLATVARDEGTRLTYAGIEIDPMRHRVTLDGEELTLRPLEYKLIATFVEHPGRVFSRAELLADVWGVQTQDTSTRTVDTHMRRLRERLGPYGDAIETVHGFGYRLKEPGT